VILARHECLAADRCLSEMQSGRQSSERRISLVLNLSAGALAEGCDLPRTRIERIAAETTGITADTTLRLGKAPGTSAQLWMNLRRRSDVESPSARSVGSAK
jgi:addiction module HigA family antidote